jgi:hypothetical protein
MKGKADGVWRVEVIGKLRRSLGKGKNGFSEKEKVT